MVDGHADLLGSRVPLLEGSMPHGAGHALVRPEAVGVSAVDETGQANASVFSVAFLGPFCRVQVRLHDGQLLVAQLPSAQATRLVQDAPVRVEIAADAVLVVAD